MKSRTVYTFGVFYLNLKAFPIPFDKMTISHWKQNNK